MHADRTYACRRCCTDARTCGQYLNVCQDGPLSSAFQIHPFARRQRRRQAPGSRLALDQDARFRPQDAEPRGAGGKAQGKGACPNSIVQHKRRCPQVGVDGMRCGQPKATVLACLRPGGPSRPHDLTPGDPFRRMRTARRT